MGSGSRVKAVPGAEAVLLQRLRRAEAVAAPSERSLNRLERAAKLAQKLSTLDPGYHWWAAEATALYANQCVACDGGPMPRVGMAYSVALRHVDRAISHEDMTRATTWNMFHLWSLRARIIASALECGVDSKKTEGGVDMTRRKLLAWLAQSTRELAVLSDQMQKEGASAFTAVHRRTA